MFRDRFAASIPNRITNANLALFAISLTIALTFAVYSYWPWRLEAAPCDEFLSPDGQYKIVVYPYVEHGMRFPGQGRDGPGKIFLKGPHGKTISSQDIEMLLNVEKPEWSEHHVSMKLVLEWDF